MTNKTSGFGMTLAQQFRKRGLLQRASQGVLLEDDISVLADEILQDLDLSISENWHPRLKTLARAYLLIGFLVGLPTGISLLLFVLTSILVITR